MLFILILGIIIVFAVLALSIVTTNKAYAYKHQVDTPDQNPYLQHGEPETK
ncbi:MAG: YtzI protein [Bacillaceae bacterium]